MSRPVIGITTYAQEASWGVWRLPAALIPLNYVEAVERAGGRPVLIPPSEDGVAETIEALDGIVFSGGADVDPAHYGADAHPETDAPQAHRDEGELALLRSALEQDLPTLAVCRGFQLLNVARGGDLVQHLPDAVGTDGDFLMFMWERGLPEDCIVHRPGPVEVVPPPPGPRDPETGAIP